MFKLMTFFFHTFPLILAWLYLLVAVVLVLLLHKRFRDFWAVLILNISYITLFLITRIFFSQLWESFFSFLGLFAILISSAWSRYDDKRNGKRWWNW